MRSIYFMYLYMYLLVKKFQECALLLFLPLSRLLPDAGDEVSARDFHSAVCLTDRIVIFGGRCER